MTDRTNIHVCTDTCPMGEQGIDLVKAMKGYGLDVITQVVAEGSDGRFVTVILAKDATLDEVSDFYDAVSP